MTANNIFKVIKEGQATLQVPKTVFYNPVQEFNRDLSVLVLRTYLKHNVWHHKSEEKHVKARGGLKILDALSASGLRSIRYAKELGAHGSIVKKIVANDLSTTAVELIKQNIALNNVQDKVESSLSDAITVLHRSALSFDDKFHVIDIDPFGSGAQFFDAAVYGIAQGGLLMVTCTDTAVLCGNAGESCFARYGSMPMRADFCHEAALRIILRSIESHASVYGKFIKPLLSISVDFYVRLFIQVISQQAETKKSASKLSQMYLCKQCRTVEFVRLGECITKEDAKQAASDNPAVKYKFKPSEVDIGDKCRICGGTFSLGGPLWTERMHDSEFLNLLKQELALPETKEEFATFRRIQGMVHMCAEELGEPLFYSRDEMARVLRTKVPGSKEIMSALANDGYKVSLSHTNKCGIKTNAPRSVVWDVFCQLLEKDRTKRDPSADEDPVARAIFSRPRSKIYNFSHNPSVEAESQKLSMLRYQVNPTRDWGPKPRPLAPQSPQATEDSTAKDVNVESETSIDNSKRRKLDDNEELPVSTTGDSRDK